MAETTNSRVTDAIKPDGFVDFYGLLEQPTNAPADTLRARINTLYSEAQANRDHRNLNKRREYQTLLDWLPRAKSALLEPEKRARYNAYLASVQTGTAEVDFEEFMSDLLGQSETMEEKTALLGVQDKMPPIPARVVKTPTAMPQAKPTRPEPTAPVAPMAIGGALIGLVLGALIGNAIGGIVPAILVAFILGALVFALLNRKPRGGVSL